MEKLLAANAIKIGENNEPSFTPEFQNYISIYSGLNNATLQFVHGWRQMLSTFNSDLNLLADEEIATIVTLLEYQVKARQSHPASV